jgi:hypothetical protein
MKVNGLEDRAEGNARKPDANEVAILEVLLVCGLEKRVEKKLTALEPEFWQQAMFCLHCWLMRSWTPMRTDSVSICCSTQGHLERLTGNIELGALVEETKTLSTGASTDQVAESTSKDTIGNLGGVTSVGGLVTARKLSLVTALVGGLLDGHVVGDGELDVRVTLVANTVASELGIGGRREGRNGGGESNNGSSDGELHCGCGWNERWVCLGRELREEENERLDCRRALKERVMRTRMNG